ncbi:MAG: hypothetical protein CL535_11430 [Ahrensia sp.]|nr:hypothetical protein [Ahrensia sp.]
MKKVSLVACVGIVMTATATDAPAAAQSCWELWYERNHRYAVNGFCFSTDLGKRTFSEFDCWTKNPDLTRAEQARIDVIRAEEKRRSCKVN